MFTVTVDEAVVGFHHFGCTGLDFVPPFPLHPLQKAMDAGGAGDPQGVMDVFDLIDVAEWTVGMGPVFRDVFRLSVHEPDRLTTEQPFMGPQPVQVPNGGGQFGVEDG